jgi:ABC-type transporter Mla MlaB component
MGKVKREGTRLEISGRLSIQDGVKLKELMLEAYRGTTEPVLDFSGAETMDLACVQVLCSASRSFRKAGKALEVEGLLPVGVRSSLKDMALDNKGCAEECAGRCLWGTGGSDE